MTRRDQQRKRGIKKRLMYFNPTPPCLISDRNEPET